ncbi:hypothetical protein SpCBS45565_g03353 [Spizellomyces sp. 'palustris']|nr:hypothetical protein SpCBS45565_g03353 [Spizellomyces sp. 'palustris']
MTDRLTSALPVTIPNLRSYPETRSAPLHPPWRNGSKVGKEHSTASKESELTAGTRGVLKSMMRSSKLSQSQQRFLDSFLQGGAPLPATPTPGMSFRPSSSASSPVSYYKTIVPRAHLPPTHRPQIRTLAQIAQTDAFEIDMYRPTPKKNYALEKDRLQTLMATNGHTSPAAESDIYSETQPNKRTNRHHGDDDDDVLDEFDMVMKEIEDRRQWLDDMIALGHGEKFKRQIQTEIAQRIRRLEQIDRERTLAARIPATRT